MKMKLLLLLGLIVGSLGVSAFFSGNAFAVGEAYRWENDNTIIGSGGNYNNKIQRNSNPGTTTRAVPVETVTFTRVGTSAVYKAPTDIFYTVQTSPTAGGSRTCNLQLAITVNSTNTATGNLKVNDTGVEQCTDSGLSTTASITGTSPDPASLAGGGEAADGASEEVVNTCDIDGVGWIVCPVMNFIGGITDHAYMAVQALLTTQPLTFNADSNPTRDAWAIMRNFANIVFVIFFLFVIFSQLTSFGISNYGIKKILPRLIIVAILVNASYIICAIAVDLSNILGVSLKGLFDNISQNYNINLDNQDAQGVFNGQNMFANIIGAVLAGGGALAITSMVGLSILLPIMISALVAIVTVVAVLTLRQALIIILIVISPLAFVAFLLPNTEDWFKKWRKLFTTLLLMYPVIAVIFGASAFAGTIIMNSASGDNKVLIQIMGAGVTIIPLFITPIVMRTAGGLLNRFGGVINNPNKGPFDRMRKGAEGIRKRQEGRRAYRELSGKRGMGFGRYKREARRDAINAGVDASKKRASQNYIAQQMGSNKNFQNQAAGGTMFNQAGQADLQRVLAGAKFTIQQADAEEVKAEHAFVDSMDASQLKNIIDNKGGDNSEARVAAAIERFVKVGDTKDIADVVDTYANNGNTESLINKTLANSLAQDGPQFLKASDIDNIARGQLGAQRIDENGNKVFDENGKPELVSPRTFKEIAQNNIEGGVLSEKKMVASSNDELGYASRVAAEKKKENPEYEGVQKLANTANSLLVNEVLKGEIKHNMDSIQFIANQAPSPATTVNTTMNTPDTPASAPGTLNISHTPSGATPANSRTSVPPNTSGYKPTSGDPNGLSLPPDFKR